MFFFSIYNAKVLKYVPNTDLVGNVMDGDVMHGCSVTLEQSMEVSPTMPETENRHYLQLPTFIYPSKKT